MIGPFRSDVWSTSKFFSAKGHKTAVLNLPSSTTLVLRSDDNLDIHNMGSQLRLKGYIQNVSPIIKTHATHHSFPYFNFSLQISDSTTPRAICYDPRRQKLLKHYQHSREPATFTNITEKRSLLDPPQDNIIVTKRSRIQPANNDIPFEYSEDSTAQNPQMLTALHKVASLNDKQIISVKGVVTLCPEPFPAPSSQQQKIVFLFQQHKLSMTSLMPQQSLSAKLVSLTNSTSFSCTNCAWSLSQPTSITTTATAKCPSCKATQRISSCDTKSSVRIAVRRDNTNDLIWLTAFNPIFQQMLDHSPGDVSLQSQEEEIYSQLFKLENFTIEYSEASSVIKNIYF